MRVIGLAEIKNQHRGFAVTAMLPPRARVTDSFRLTANSPPSSFLLPPSFEHSTSTKTEPPLTLFSASISSFRSSRIDEGLCHSSILFAYLNNESPLRPPSFLHGSTTQSPPRSRRSLRLLSRIPRHQPPRLHEIPPGRWPSRPCHFRTKLCAARPSPQRCLSCPRSGDIPLKARFRATHPSPRSQLHQDGCNARDAK